MLIESLSGVRGYEEQFTPEFVAAYARAFTDKVGKGKILIGRDTRRSGPRIFSLLSRAIQDGGQAVVDLGICPTPTVQYAVEYQRAAGGIVVTASHNPLPWNGLKFIGPDGLFLDADEMRSLQSKRIQYTGHAPPPATVRESIQVYQRAIEDHISLVTKLPYVNPAAIRKRRFKIVVDAVNGAAYAAVPRLLKLLGAEIISINCHADRPFPRDPEPLPKNLKELNRAVRKNSADLGFAIDPDGDRLAVVSEQGEPISEEYTLVLAEKLVLSRLQKENMIVVANLSTTQAVDRIAEQYKARVIRTPIGEIKVARKMREVGAVIGGEGNGGVLLPEAHLGRDSLVGCALILQLLADDGRSLSTLLKDIPRFVMLKEKVERGDLKLEALESELIELAPRAEIDRQDGVKFSWDDRWVHLRPSNTEPIIRIYAEAPEIDTARQTAAPFIEFIRQKARTQNP